LQIIESHKYQKLRDTFLKNEQLTNTMISHRKADDMSFQWTFFTPDVHEINSKLRQTRWLRGLWTDHDFSSQKKQHELKRKWTHQTRVGP